MDDKLFNQLLTSARQAAKISRGKIKAKRRFEYKACDVKVIRRKVGLTQAEFSIMIGVSLRTLQNWEQGHRKPVGPALALLTVFKNDPQHAFQALHDGH